MSLSKDLHNLLECSICLETFKDPKTLPCNHRYCKHCLQQQVEKSVTKTSTHNFSCPLCKRETKLSKQKPSQEWTDIFESDRLLRDIIDRLSLEKDAEENMCRHHMMKLEIVCYNCNIIGCLRCAWLNHRRCDQVESFVKQVQVQHAKLKSSLKDMNEVITMIFLHSKYWSIAERSFQNQVQYSREFVKKYVKNRKRTFNKELVHLIETVSLYKFRNISSQDGAEFQVFINVLMTALDINDKCDGALNDAKKRMDTIMTSDIVRNASFQLAVETNREKLQTISDQLSDALQQDVGEMIFSAKRICVANEEILSPASVTNTKRLMSPRPKTFLLNGLIVACDQIHLDLSREEKIMANLHGLLNKNLCYYHLLIGLRKLCLPESTTPQPVTRGSVFESYAQPRSCLKRNCDMRMHLASFHEDEDYPYLQPWRTYVRNANVMRSRSYEERRAMVEYEMKSGNTRSYNPGKMSQRKFVSRSQNLTQIHRDQWYALGLLFIGVFIMLYPMFK